MELPAEIDAEAALRDHPRHPLVEATSTVEPEGAVAEASVERVDFAGEVIETAGGLRMLASPPLM